MAPATPRGPPPSRPSSAHLRERAPETRVRLAFLELMAPPLEDAGAELVALGCQRIDVVPAFLGAGGHVRRDVPAQLARLRDAHPGIAWTLHPPLGENAHVISALADATIDLAELGFASGHSPLDGIGT